MGARVLAVFATSLAILPGCNDDGDGGPIELPMPTFFELHAEATAEEADLSVHCSLGFAVEITGEVSRTREVVEYIATMGGEAVRDLRRPDGSGVVLSAFAYYPQLQVLHILPDRVQLISLDFPPDGPSTGSRFWDELRFFDGRLEADRSISGEWLCAPLDVEQGGIDDDSLFADGTWETVEIVESR